MAETPSEDASPEILRSFVTMHSRFISEALPRVLSRRAFSALQIESLLKETPAEAAEHELGRFHHHFNLPPSIIIDCIATRGRLDEFHDILGENCFWANYDSALMNTRFQPIRLEDRANKQQLGVVYTVRHQIEGQHALVLAGVEYRAALVENAASLPVLIGRTFASMSEIAQQNQLAREIYSAVGMGSTREKLNDEGVTAQHDKVREALWDIARALDAPILRLKKQINFPSPSDPIRAVRRVF